jgi:hypothetical protein
MAERIPSALSPEQWRSWADPPDPDDPDRGQTYGRDAIQYAITDAEAPDRHALAALALHGQPFGFTWEDVEAVNDAAHEYRLIGIAPIDPRSAAYNAVADVLYSLTNRIAALLPPREAA